MVERTLTAGAVVLRLPTADLPPVQQQPGRRGRYPKGIAALWRERMNRSPELRALKLLAALERAAAARDECVQRSLVAAKVLRAAEKEDLRIGAEYSALAALVAQIEREIAELARKGSEQ